MKNKADLFFIIAVISTLMLIIAPFIDSIDNKSLLFLVFGSILCMTASIFLFIQENNKK
jgi:hypothetical protein